MTAKRMATTQKLLLLPWAVPHQATLSKAVECSPALLVTPLTVQRVTASLVKMSARVRLCRSLLSRCSALSSAAEDVGLPSVQYNLHHPRPLRHSALLRGPAAKDNLGHAPWSCRRPATGAWLQLRSFSAWLEVTLQVDIFNYDAVVFTSDGQRQAKLLCVGCVRHP